MPRIPRQRTPSYQEDSWCKMKSSTHVLETLGRDHHPVEVTDGEYDVGYLAVMPQNANVFEIK